MKKLFFYILTSISFITSYSQLSPNDETFHYETVEFSTNDFYKQLYKVDNTPTPIVSYKGFAYFIYVDSLRQPKLGKIQFKQQSQGIQNEQQSQRIQNENDTFFLEEGYVIKPDDGHHKFSIGIDKDGYIHVIGDMHNYGTAPRDNDIYPINRQPTDYWGIYDDNWKIIKGMSARTYSREDLDNVSLYWKSNKPESIEGGFEFLGGRNEERTVPGFSCSYQSFHTDMNGELYLRQRSKVSYTSHYNGEMGWILAKYDTASQRWEELGALPPSASMPKKEDGYSFDYEPLYKAIFWEDNGLSLGIAEDRKEGRHWYQGFNADMTFDFNNRMHLTTTINNDDLREFCTHVLYAYSDDNGASFNQADGAPVELPIRVKEGTTVADDSEFGYHKNWSSVCFDKEGTPFVNYSKLESENESVFLPGVFKYWDKENKIWSEEILNHAGGKHSRTKNILDANGIITFVSPNEYNTTRRDFGFNSIDIANRTIGTKTEGVFFGIDHKGIRENNVLRGFYYNPDIPDNPLEIRVMYGTPNLTPISEEWSTTSLGRATGETGMFNDIFQLKSTGNFNENFSGEYVNQTVTGDFELEARVINVNFINEDSFAGLMVRENNEEGSSFFGTAITSYNGVKTISKGASNDAMTIAKDYEPSEWLKIKRKGNILESYRSDNGKNWKKLDSREIEMSKTVTYGLVSGSGSSTVIGHARIDHVSLTDSNLIAHYQFNNNILDATKNKLNGINNGISFDENSNYIVGRFNGESSVSVKSNELLKTEKITVSAWIKPSENNTDTRGLIKSVNSNGYDHGWRLTTGGTNLAVRVTTNQGSASKTAKGLILNSWNYVAFSYDGESIELYINDNEPVTIGQSGNIKYASPNISMSIGASNGTNNFSGEIDEVKIYNSALDKSSILRNYQTEQNYFLSSISSKNLLNSITQDTNITEQDNIIITLYPNPTNGAINIMYPDFSGNEEIQIIDTTGRTLISKKLQGVNSIIDISNLESSIYFVKISTPNGKVNVRKIIVE